MTSPDSAHKVLLAFSKFGDVSHARGHSVQDNRSDAREVQAWFGDAIASGKTVEAVLEGGAKFPKGTDKDQARAIFKFTMLGKAEPRRNKSGRVVFTQSKTDMVISATITEVVEDLKAKKTKYIVSVQKVITAIPQQHLSERFRWTGNAYVPANEPVKDADGEIVDLRKIDLPDDYRLVARSGPNGDDPIGMLITNDIRETHQWTNIRPQRLKSSRAIAMLLNTWEETFDASKTSITKLGVELSEVMNIRVLHGKTYEYFLNMYFEMVFQKLVGIDDQQRAYIRTAILSHLNDAIGPSIGEHAEIVIPSSGIPYTSLTDAADNIRQITAEDVIVRIMLSRFLHKQQLRTNTYSFNASQRSTQEARVPISFINYRAERRQLVYTYGSGVEDGKRHLKSGVLPIIDAGTFSTDPESARVIGEFFSVPKPYETKDSHMILLRHYTDSGTTLEQSSLDPIISEACALCYNRVSRPISSSIEVHAVSKTFVIWHPEFMLLLGIRKTQGSPSSDGAECYIVPHARLSKLVAPMKNKDDTLLRSGQRVHTRTHEQLTRGTYMIALEQHLRTMTVLRRRPRRLIMLNGRPWTDWGSDADESDSEEEEFF
jgi:hypothetical protein